MDARTENLRELAEGLSRARDAAGLSQTAMAEVVGGTQSHMTRVLRGQRLLTPEQVDTFARACGVDDAERERLHALAIAVSREHVDARLILQRGSLTFQNRIRDLERDAVHVREYQPAMVAGPCQTGGYARAIHSQTVGRNTAAQLDALVEHRVARGAAMAADTTRRWEILHTEGALGWGLGGPEVMAGQCEHLAELSRLKHVRIGVVPFGRSVDFTMLHGFSVYRTPGDSHTVDAGQIGTVLGNAMPTAGADLAVLDAKFDRLRDAAVFDDEARAILARLALRYREADA